MSIKQVIESGKLNYIDSILYTVKHNAEWFILGFLLVFLIGFIIVLLTCIQSYRQEKKNIDFNKKAAIKEAIWLSIIAPMVCGLIVFFVFATDYRDMRKDWEQNIVSEYIDSLEEKEVEIEAVDRMDGIYKEYYTKKELNTNLMNVDVLYADEKGYGNTYKGEAVIVFDLKETDKPYMTYKYVERDLGMNHRNYILEKGIYNPVIHVPKNKFFNQ